MIAVDPAYPNAVPKRSGKSGLKGSYTCQAKKEGFTAPPGTEKKV
jgi:hypothetical protein